MGYLSETSLKQLGFGHLGRNVKISDKASLYQTQDMIIGDHCRIDDFCVVSGKITMGRNVYIGPLSLVAGGRPGIVFEDFVTLAWRTQVFTQSDDYSGATMTNPTIPAAYKNEVEKPVRLGRHSIVGAGSIVGPGVDMGEGTSVGAAALVLDDTNPWTVYVGSPARRLKDRERGLLALEQEYLAQDG